MDMDDLRHQLGDELFEEVSGTMEANPFRIAWEQMYPVATGPWVETDEDCKNFPDCACNGKKQVRKIFDTANN